MAYCHECDRGSVSRIQRAAEVFAERHILEGIAKSISLKHTIDVIEVEMKERVAPTGRFP